MPQLQIGGDGGGISLTVQSPSAETTTSTSTDIGAQLVSSASDLPSASGGVRELTDGTVYIFTDFVADDATLRLGDPSPLLAWHGGSGGYIHTGGSAALKSDGEPFFARDAYFGAPGGTMFDLAGAGDQTTEMLVESCSFADAAGLGNISDLGTIESYRVPTFKGCNFEDFDAGITFTGLSDKVFFSECPLRTVTASDVTIIEFDANAETDVVDITDCYIKEVQPDTKVVDYDESGIINEIFQYRGITHDSSVTESNILNGQVGAGAVGSRVSDSFPLADSGAFANYSLDTNSSASISSVASSKTDESAYVKVPGATTAFELERFEHSDDNEVTYLGERTRLIDMTASLTVGAGDAIIVAAFFKNGSLLTGTPTRVQSSFFGIDKHLTVPGVAPEIDTGDTLDVRVANMTDTDDIDVGELHVKISD